MRKTRVAGHISGFASRGERDQDLREGKHAEELLRRARLWWSELPSTTTTLVATTTSRLTTTAEPVLAASSTSSTEVPKTSAYHWPDLPVRTRTKTATATVTTSTSTMGPVLNSGDSVFVKSASGDWLTTFGDAVSAGNTPSRFIVEKLRVSGVMVSGHWKEEDSKVVRGVIHSGEMISLRAPSGRYLDVEHNLVRARWDHHTPQQTFVVQGGDLTVHAGDRVFLTPALNRNFIDVQGGAVRARWNVQGDLQALTLEKAPPMPSIRVLDD